MKFASKIFASILAALSSVCVYAQENEAPNIAYVYPAGAQRGTTTKIVVGGVKFANVESIYISGNGIKVNLGELTIPATKGAVAGLRTKMEAKYIKEHPELHEQFKDNGPAMYRKIREMLMADPEIRKNFNDTEASYCLRVVSSDALAETIEFEVEIAPDAELGDRILSVVTPLGVSRPVTFTIGDLPETSKRSLRDFARERAKLPENYGRSVDRLTRTPPIQISETKEAMDITLPTVVNGQITEARTDSYKFVAKKGQGIVMAVRSQTLIPYISDAVPGWCQTILSVYDSDGKKVAFNDDFHHRPDSYIFFKVPKDDTYTMEISDAIFRSREDFLYRITIGEIPFVESVFPLGVNGDTTLRLIGKNLKNKTFDYSPTRKGISQIEIPNAYCNRIYVDNHSIKSVISDVEKMRQKGEATKNMPAQKLDMPVFVEGRIVAKGAADVYAFDLVHGKRAIVEIFARRLDSPLDSYLTISDAGGNILASSDDYEDLSFGFVTHHADSRIDFTAPATGTYYVRVTDTAGAASESHSYSLYVGPPRPDFTLYATPSIMNVIRGMTESFTVHAFRKDDFDGEIKIVAKNLPKGWKMRGGVIKAGEDRTEVLITAPADAPSTITEIEFVGEAKIGANTVTRHITAADDQMQAFYIRHLVPSAKLLVSCNKWRGTPSRLSDTKIFQDRIAQGIKLPIGKVTKIAIGEFNPGKLSILTQDFVEEIEGMKIHGCSVEKRNERSVLYLKVEPLKDNEKIKAGVKDDFVVTLFAKGRKRIPYMKVGPISYEIVNSDEGSTVYEFATEAPKVKQADVKAGKEAIKSDKKGQKAENQAKLAAKETASPKKAIAAVNETPKKKKRADDDGAVKNESADSKK